MDWIDIIILAIAIWFFGIMIYMQTDHFNNMIKPKNEKTIKRIDGSGITLIVFILAGIIVIILKELGVI